MKSLFARVVSSIAITASLAACAGAGTIIPLASRQPSAVQQPLVSMPTAAHENATSSPCNFKVWYLRGSCIKYAMGKKGTTVALAAYHGITLTMLWPPPNPPQPNTFVSGDATGSGDVTGIYDGKRFPTYGSAKCIDPSFHPITCPGKAFLYSVTLNATSFEIGFHTSPKIKITNKGSYPGTKCIVASLQHLRTWEWQILNVPYAEPVGGTLTIRSGPPLTFSSGGGYYFAYVCK